MKNVFLVLAVSLVAATISSPAHAFRTKRVPPRESCGNAANSYCVDVTEKEVPCGTRAAEWKICVYAGDEEENSTEEK